MTDASFENSNTDFDDEIAEAEGYIEKTKEVQLKKTEGENVIERASEENRIEGETEEKKNASDSAEKARVSPLDPDFLAYALPLAFLLDSSDLFFEFAGVFIVPKIIGLILDIAAMVLIGGWIYLRTKKITNIKSQGEKAQKLGKKLMKGPTGKVLSKVGLAFLLEAVPFVGLFFSWTFAVVSTLWEKGE